MTAPERGPNHHILARDIIFAIVCSSIFCFLNFSNWLGLAMIAGNKLLGRLCCDPAYLARLRQLRGDWRPLPCVAHPGPGQTSVCWISRQYTYILHINMAHDKLDSEHPFILSSLPLYCSVFNVVEFPTPTLTGLVLLCLSCCLKASTAKGWGSTSLSHEQPVPPDAEKFNSIQDRWLQSVSVPVSSVVHHGRKKWGDN